MYSLYRMAVVFVGCLLSAAVGPTDALAQQVGQLFDVNASGVPYYVYAESGDPTIRVYVVGGGAGGVYDIGVGTRFDEFLAIASVAPGVSSGRTRQRVEVQLYRTDDAGQRRVVLEGRASELLRANPDTYPRLRDGDFLAVEITTRQRFGWRDGLRILTSLSTVILLVDRFARVF